MIPAPGEGIAVETRPLTRRDEQRAQTRRDLLDAAARVFAERGYHTTSVDQVAEAAGFTKGAVYSNFTSKEELFLELLDRQIDQAVGVLEQVLEDTPPEERARAFGEQQASIAVLDRNWFLLDTEFLLYAARNEHIRERVAERQRRTRQRIADIVQRHLDDLGITDPPVSATDVARIVTATADGLTQASLIQHGEEEDAPRLLSALIELLTLAATAHREGT